MHPSTKQLLEFFAYAHLSDHLAEVSEPFGVLANRVAAGHQCAETTAALRKLLEAKDCAVRAAVLGKYEES